MTDSAGRETPDPVAEPVLAVGDGAVAGEATGSAPASPPQASAPLATPPAVERTPSRQRVKKTNMNGPLYMQASGSNVVLVRRLKRKDNGAWKHLARWFVENQIGLSFNLLALLFLAHVSLPRAQAHTRRFFSLSYYNPDTGRYGVGLGDLNLVFFYIVLFTGLRAATMEYVLAPFGKLAGLSKRKDLTRFSEQMWMLMYYGVFWPLGVYIYFKSDYYLNLKGLWANWPDREIDGLTKKYMLVQWAFWLQQIFVINIEERRKDHWQMFTHHLVTVALVSSSYAYHQTRVGHLILILMDVVDLILPIAKCLKYAGFSTLCDVMFGVFMVSWFVSRQVFYPMVWWSVYADIPVVIDYGCYRGTKANLSGPAPVPSGYGHLLEPFYDPQGAVCWDNGIKWAFLLPLLFLQVLIIVWFVMVVRVALKVLRGEGAEDSRSDDEGEDEDEFVYEEARPVEEEVGVESIDLKGWERRTGVKRQAGATGVSLPGHSDRKELLGRIGCEKQVD